MGYSWNWGVLFDPTGLGDQLYLHWVLSGLGWLFVIGTVAWVIALALGTVLGIMRTLPSKNAQRVATAYVTLFRNVPVGITVTDFAGLRRANNGIDTGIDNVVRYDNLNFHFRQKIHHILRTTVQLGMAFLAAKTFHLSDRHAGNTDFSQCFADIVQLEVFNNRINLFHAIP